MEEQKNNLLEIEHAKGVLIEPNGSMHFFGKQRYELASEISDENDHENSFNATIVDEEWFQSLIEQAKISYKKKNNGSSVNIYKFTPLLAGNGIVVILNGSALTARNEEYNLYMFEFPSQLSPEQQEILESNYTGLKEMLERKHSYVDGMAYDKQGNDAWQVTGFNVDNLDEIYDRLNLNKAQGKRR